MIERSLHHNWQFKERQAAAALAQDFCSDQGWLAATVPGTVQQDLLAQGLLPDPFYGLNEPQVQWVGQRDWLYRLSFEVDAALLAQPHVELYFAGLDTFCTVWLNGEVILRSENMFVPHTVDVKSRLRAGENALHLLFENVLDKGRQLETAHGQRALWNGASSRLYVRKAQYHYGWDWGPVLLTAGPWQPVTLRAYTARIEDIHVPAEVTPDLTAAFVPVHVTLGGDLNGLQVTAELRGPDGQPLSRQTAPAQPLTSFPFEVTGPQLWWPNGQGVQPLYSVALSLHHPQEVLDAQEQRFGLRRLRVVQEPVEGEPGSSFTFEVNNQPLFIGGANWIPGDLLLNRLDAGQYRERLTQARDAHLNMIRVWGGGVYEPDDFYTLCDELGLLVWQDFMFACGLYPAHPEFQASVRLEAEAAVRRLRNHPCVALWAGNNEDYAIAEALGAQDDDTRFSAKVIYEKLLPELCTRLDPGRLYWPGSPWGGVNSADPTVGDRHSWEVWHGMMAPYQEYRRFQARFVSEFGMQSAPALSTIASFAPQAERYPESRTLVHHNKATNPQGEPDGQRRLAAYLSDNLRAYRDLDEYVYHTQFIQAEAMRYAYRDFRRRFERPGRYAVSGALVWQLNDCWPVSSWAVIDSAGIAKPALYAIAREMSPLAAGMRRGSAGLEVWISSAERAACSVALTLYAYTLHGELVAQDSREVRVLPARLTPLAPWQVPGDDLVYFAELKLSGQIVSRSADFPEPYKFYDLRSPDLHAEYLSPTSLRVQASRPTKGVWLDTGASVAWDDNFLDLRPGEARVITAPNLAGRPVRVQALDTAPGAISLRGEMIRP